MDESLIRKSQTRKDPRSFHSPVVKWAGTERFPGEGLFLSFESKSTLSSSKEDEKELGDEEAFKREYVERH